MVRRNIVIFWCLEVIGGMCAVTGWCFDRPVPLAVGLAVCAADVLFELLFFRCPHCGRYLGLAKYDPARACPHCGASLRKTKEFS